MTEAQLQLWHDFLSRQIAAFDAAYEKRVGKPHRAEDTLIAFLELNDAMAADTVKDAVESFSHSLEWSKSLTPDQLVNLTHRAVGMQGLLLAMMKAPRLAEQLGMPVESDSPAVVRWLFVDCWRVAGPEYVKALSDAWFAGRR